MARIVLVSAVLFCLVLLGMVTLSADVANAVRIGGWKPSGKSSAGPPGSGPRGPGGPRGPRGPGGEGIPDEGDDDHGEYNFDEMGEPGQNGGHKPKIDKCLKQAIKHCSLDTMEHDFSSFISCIYNARNSVKSDCFEWAENHGGCATELIEVCPKKNPPETTECIMANRDTFSDDCKTSEFFKSLVEGYDQFKAHNEMNQGKPKDKDYHKKTHEDYKDHEEIDFGKNEDL